MFKLMGNKFIITEFVDTPQLVAGITGREAGNMALHIGDNTNKTLRNRQLLAEEINFDLSRWVCGEQTHGTNIKKIDSSYCGRGVQSHQNAILDTDGMYTFSKDILLTVQVADCVPLYFFHKKSGCIGVVHAGWRGTVAGIARVMVNKLVGEGILASEIKVIIGPAICQGCLIVGREVIEFLHGQLGNVGNTAYVQETRETYLLDVHHLNKIILLNSGIRADMIMTSKLCTKCSNNHFFSYRLEGETSGRQIAYLGWKE